MSLNDKFLSTDYRKPFEVGEILYQEDWSDGIREWEVTEAKIAKLKKQKAAMS